MSYKHASQIAENERYLQQVLKNEDLFMPPVDPHRSIEVELAPKDVDKIPMEDFPNRLALDDLDMGVPKGT